MQSTSPKVWDQLKGGAWLLLGLFLLLAFFLPNYTTPILDIDGLDLLRTATRDPEAMKRLVQDLPTFFMVITPFAYWALGFFAVFVGILGISGKGFAVGKVLMILAGIVFLMSMLTIFLLLNRNDTPSFFAKMLPKPGTVFYLSMVAESGIVVVGILSEVLRKRA